MKFINEMRERPEEERFAFAVLAAGAVAVILFFAWGASFFSGGGSNNAEVINDTSAQTASAVEGLRDLGNEFSNVTGEFSAQYEQLKRALDDAGLGNTPAGVNTVDLSVDKNGDVQVKNIIVEKNTEQ